MPLLREDHLLGGLVVNRKSAGAFAPDVIDLLKTFATQSALAIQNARLFREIGDKSRQLEIASQHKSEFLANMSHELRTPLNAIIGFSEVLAERMFGEINDKQAEYLADILESGRHLLSLINDILDLSKIEAGRMELDLADFDLPGAIDNTMTLVRERAHRRGIALERNVDARVGKIRGDERKVKQVLLNLLSNALKFTPEGGRIDVRADVRDDRYEISVTDTGVGIAPEDLDAVFEEFRQVGSAAKKVEGTGLGLAISRKFIELHGGRIWATSQVGIGSTFAFTLPLTTPQGRSSVDARSPGSAHGPSRARSAPLALDRDAELLHAGDRRELGHAHLDPRRAELAHQQVGDRLREALHQLVRMVGGESLQALHDRRVVERVGEVAGAEHGIRRQSELDIEAQRLRPLLLPIVDADARLDAQIVDEDRVHAALLESARCRGRARRVPVRCCRSHSNRRSDPCSLRSRSSSPRT